MFLHFLVDVIVVVLFFESEHALEFDDLFAEVAVVGLGGLDSLLVVVNGGSMLSLPLFEDAFLHHHYLVGFLVAHLAAFFGLQECVLELRDLEVAFVVEFVDTVMVESL